MNGGNQSVRASRVASRTLTALLLCSAGSVHAQEAPPAPAVNDAETTDTAAPGAGDIIVTAQRRNERLQDVPIAISAVGSEELAQMGANDVSALRGSVPGLSISSTAGISVSNIISIRGVGGLPSSIGASQATGLYVDGVYLPRADAAFFTLDDVERVEVLRGPQGTLYGRNATAGAINIITREPGDTVEGGFDLSYGNYNAVVAKGSVSGPLAEGLSIGVSGAYNTRDGYFVNTVTGNRVGAERGYTVRAKLRYANPDESFTANLTGDISRRNQEYVIPNFFRSRVTGGLIGVPDYDLIQMDAATESQLGTVTKGRGAALTLTYSPSDTMEITSVSSARSVRTQIAYDTDGTAFPDVLGASINKAKTLSQELRVVYSGDRFRATVGGNYYNEKGSFGLSATPPTIVPVYKNPFTSTEVDAYALFGQVEFDLTNRLTLVGGLRYNYETRDFLVDYTGAPVNRGIASGNVNDETLIPSAGINFKVTPDILLYAKFSRGYQAPGYSGTAVPANTFGAEHLTAYEAGIKSQLFDRRVTFNAAGFYYDYKNLQVRTVIGTGLIQINNAAAATVKGLEASLSIDATDFFSLSAQGQYLYAKYSSFCDGFTPGNPQADDPLCGVGRADRSGNRLNLAPEWSGGVNANFHFPVNDAGDFTARISYVWESNIFFTSANEDLVRSGGYHRVDARVAFPLAKEAEIYVFGRNLTDKRYINYAQRGGVFSVGGGRNDPRAYGVGLRYRF